MMGDGAPERELNSSFQASYLDETENLPATKSRSPHSHHINYEKNQIGKQSKPRKDEPYIMVKTATVTSHNNEMDE